MHSAAQACGQLRNDLSRRLDARDRAYGFAGVEGHGSYLTVDVSRRWQGSERGYLAVPEYSDHFEIELVGAIHRRAQDPVGRVGPTVGERLAEDRVLGTGGNEHLNVGRVSV